MILSMTLIIIGITVAASFYAWNRADIYEKWMMNPYRIKRNKEFYRFITSGFIHSGYVHLGFNMLAFYSFGTYVELSFGSIPFLLLYLIAIIVSDIPTFLKQQNNPGYRSLGASGGVSAILFSSILLNPLSGIGLLILPGIRISAFIFGIIYLIYSYYQAKNSTDNIGHESHFYGALFGILFTVIIYPETLGNFFKQISTWSIF
jgi:membrane associated rhomboid family serine protease